MAGKQSSAQKAARQAEKRQPANRSARRRVKTLVRKAEEGIAAGGDTAAGAVRGAVAALDKATAQGRLHKNNAARRKSRLAKKLNAAQAPS